MSKRAVKALGTSLPSSAEPNSLACWRERYLDWLKVRNFAPGTLKNSHEGLVLFGRWAETRGLLRPHDITRPMLEAYQRFVFHCRTRRGKPLSFRSQRLRLLPLRGFFRWLTRQNVLLSNPASDLEMPKVPVSLPKTVLTASEMEAVLSLPKVDTLFGLRDRAMLETFYSTGMRRQELVNLSLYDVDAERGVVMIRQGKGGRDRVVPIGERALVWVDKYVYEVRPRLVTASSQATLFLTVRV
jgi:integrase/recombinase XerD